MNNQFATLSNYELIDCYYCLRLSLGEKHSLVMQAQEELFARMEDQE
jgi:hypothetical protein